MVAAGFGVTGLALRVSLWLSAMLLMVSGLTMITVESDDEKYRMDARRPEKVGRRFPPLRHFHFLRLLSRPGLLAVCGRCPAVLVRRLADVRAERVLESPLSGPSLSKPGDLGD